MTLSPVHRAVSRTGYGHTDYTDVIVSPIIGTGSCVFDLGSLTSTIGYFDLVLVYQCDIDSPWPAVADVGESTTSAVARLLTELRSTLGLTIADLARLVRVERATIYSWLRGAARPHPANVRRVRDLHGLVDDLELTELLEIPAHIRLAVVDELAKPAPSRGAIRALLPNGPERRRSAFDRADSVGIRRELAQLSPDEAYRRMGRPFRSNDADDG